MQLRAGTRLSTSDNILTALSLFTAERPEWTVEEVATALDVSGSTAYRYFSSLARFDLITPAASGRYVLGPAIIALDRQIRLLDPLVQVAEPVMRKLMRQHPGEGIALLCRLYRDQVICVHQVHERKLDNTVSYERGRPMGLYRGSASQVILAHLPIRTLRRLWQDQSVEIGDAALGASWEAFLATLRQMRAKVIGVTHGQLDRGVVGISAPLFRDQRHVIGSVCIAVPEQATSAGEVAALSTLVRAAAHDIETALAQLPDAR